MNNYKQKPFIPAIQKTSTLVMLSALALLGFLISINSTTVEVSKSYTTKVKAANYMKQSMELLKSTRMVSGIFVDDENDPNETGLVGSPFSLITTDEGDLDASRSPSSVVIKLKGLPTNPVSFGSFSSSTKIPDTILVDFNSSIDCFM